MAKILRDLECDKTELSILFTDDTNITDLNRRYLGKNKATNVLAFPMEISGQSDIESCMLGDIVISVDTAKREAKEIPCSLDRRIMELLIHGVLHLLDFDHERSAEDERIMSDEEKRLLSLILEE
jgi:probable rRNA maturation factor